MPDHLFRFKNFSLSDDKSLMKIGTDSVLLGSWINETPESILDIGTGCGVIALMLAFKTSAFIDAVEIDADSAMQAIENVELNNLQPHIKVYKESFQDFVNRKNNVYDLIVTNPPFFSNSLKSPDSDRNLWRHNDLLTDEQLIYGVKKLLSKEGSFYLILPYSECKRFSEIAYSESLYIVEKLNIIPKPDKAINRVLLKIRRTKPETISENNLYIRNTDNSFTDEYKILTKDYYLDF